MSELPIPKIEKADIVAPHLQTGETAIVFQRHEKYDRTRDAETAGSLFPEAAEGAHERDVAFFNEVLEQEATDPGETMVLFMSSDTQYAGKGHRSMETAQIAQDAAKEVMESMGIDPSKRIINLNNDFNTGSFGATGQRIRPDKKIREPQIFDKPDYVDFLREKYGAEDGPGTGISPKAWAMHEMDAEKDKREEFGAEGVHEMLDRTKKSLGIVERYSRAFHASNPDKKLIVWMASHYDTLSPLVKDATGAGFDEYLPVDYGAGIVIELKPGQEPLLKTRQAEVALPLGHASLGGSSQG